ncbi:hypothetical protein H9P43_008422 [Blastocladiella emersonii ATCC 22665]|nr:hypothetical protein H9P43_008422 [Blastocladiella emersonii ATCC 22665]
MSLSAIPRYPYEGTPARPIETLDSYWSVGAVLAALQDQAVTVLTTYMAKCNRVIARYCKHYPQLAPYVSRFALASALPLALYALYSAVTLFFAVAVAAMAVVGVQAVAMVLGGLVLLGALAFLGSVLFAAFLFQYLQVASRTRALAESVVENFVAQPAPQTRAAYASGNAKITLRPHSHIAPAHLIPVADASGVPSRSSTMMNKHVFDDSRSHLSHASSHAAPLHAAPMHYIPDHHMPGAAAAAAAGLSRDAHVAAAARALGGDFDDDDLVGESEYPMADDHVAWNHHLRHRQDAVSRELFGADGGEYVADPETATSEDEEEEEEMMHDTTHRIYATALRASPSNHPDAESSSEDEEDEPVEFVEHADDHDDDDWNEQVYGGGGLALKKRASVMSTLSQLVANEIASRAASPRPASVLGHSTANYARRLSNAQQRPQSMILPRNVASPSNEWRRSLAELDDEIADDLRRIGSMTSEADRRTSRLAAAAAVAEELSGLIGGGEEADDEADEEEEDEEETYEEVYEEVVDEESDEEADAYPAAEELVEVEMEVEVTDDEAESAAVPAPAARPTSVVVASETPLPPSPTTTTSPAA